MSGNETISYTDVVIEFAESVNDLAPLVEKCFHSATPNQAMSHLHNLLTAFDKCQELSRLLKHVQGLMKSRQWHLAPADALAHVPEQNEILKSKSIILLK